MYQNNISVPHSFFKKAKKEYRDWVMAFFREMIQNSYDAHASAISFNVEKTDEHFIIEVTDNGIGMDGDTLVNVLLCLGGSQKEEGAVGGFGYAKTLLFFAHDYYTIHSKDNFIEGAGGNYDFQKSSRYIDGTHIIVHVPIQDGERNTYYFEFEDRLKEIVAYSKLGNTTITFNGDIVPDNLIQYDFQYPTPIGKVWFKDAPDKSVSKLWVRVNGLAMFEHLVWANNNSAFLGVVELNQAPTEVLTSNRDSLKGQAETEFNQIFAALQDERSSLKSAEFMDWVLNPVDVPFVEAPQEHQEPETETEQGTESAAQGQNFTVVPESDPFHKTPDTSDFNPFEKIVQANEREKTRIQKLFEQIEQSKLPSNFYIQKDDSSDVRNHVIKKKLQQKSSVDLAHKWKRIVYSVLACIEDTTFVNNEGLIRTYQGQDGIFLLNDREINVGFIFSNGVEAVNHSNKDKINILLNPLRFKNNTKVSKLFDVAFHEITHIFKENHDERFCSTEMQLKWQFRDYWNTPESKKIGPVQF